LNEAGEAGEKRPGRLLGIDHGTKVIGLAVCDALWISARPLQLLNRKSRAADFATINAIIARQQVEAIIVGLPLQPPGYDNATREEMVRRWAGRLAAAVTIPVYLWEEQFSTHEAERLMDEVGRSVEGRIDAHAAAVILQSFIDAHPAGVALPERVESAVDSEP
jgi:putative holliday junction resolvase